MCCSLYTERQEATALTHLVERARVLGLHRAQIQYLPSWTYHRDLPGLRDVEAPERKDIGENDSGAPRVARTKQELPTMVCRISGARSR